jgi:hypothetical protein
MDAVFLPGSSARPRPSNSRHSGMPLSLPATSVTQEFYMRSGTGFQPAALEIIMALQLNAFVKRASNIYDYSS